MTEGLISIRAEITMHVVYRPVGVSVGEWCW